MSIADNTSGIGRKHDAPATRQRCVLIRGLGLVSIMTSFVSALLRGVSAAHILMHVAMRVSVWKDKLITAPCMCAPSAAGHR